MAIVKDVDQNMKVELTLNDPRSRHINEGRLIDVTPSKVPRLIGRSGSMIAMLKNETNCNIFIGQNGRVWLTGKERDIDLAVRTIIKIENEAHISGLTDRIVKFLKEEKGKLSMKPEKEREVKEEIKEEVVIEEAKPEEHEKIEDEKPGGILDELLGNDK